MVPALLCVLDVICDFLWNKVQMTKSKCQIKPKTPMSKCFPKRSVIYLFPIAHLQQTEDRMVEKSDVNNLTMSEI